MQQHKDVLNSHNLPLKVDGLSVAEVMVPPSSSTTTNTKANHGSETLLTASSSSEAGTQGKRRNTSKVLMEGPLKRRISKGGWYSYLIGEWTDCYCTVVPGSGMYFTTTKKSFQNKSLSAKKILFADMKLARLYTPTKNQVSSPRNAKVNYNSRFEVHLKAEASSGWGETIIEFEAPSVADAEAWVNHIRNRLYLTVKVFKTVPGSNFPEQEHPIAPVRTRVSCCFGGGGSRAHVAALGQLRALHFMGVLNSDFVDYMSSVSGGAWASGIFTFYQSGAANDVDLLGLCTTDLSKLTMKAINEEPSPLGAIMLKEVWKETKELIWSTDPHRLWEEVIGRVYLKPFDLHLNSPFCRDVDYSTIIEMNPCLSLVEFLRTREKRPFVVLNATIVGPIWAKADEVLPLQVTPDYCGCPHVHDVCYRPRRNSEVEVKKRVGGALLPTYAFGGPADEIEDEGAGKILKNVGDLVNDQENTTRKSDDFKSIMKDKISQGAQFVLNALEDFKDFVVHQTNDENKELSHEIVKLKNPGRFFSLKHAMGITSDAPSFSMHDKTLFNRLNTQDLIIDPTNPTSKGELFGFGDGGSLDNTGLLAMLQRKVKRNIVFVNSSVTLPLPKSLQKWKDTVSSAINPSTRTGRRASRSDTGDGVPRGGASASQEKVQESASSPGEGQTMGIGAVASSDRPRGSTLMMEQMAKYREIHHDVVDQTRSFVRRVSMTLTGQDMDVMDPQPQKQLDISEGDENNQPRPSSISRRLSRKSSKSKIIRSSSSGSTGGDSDQVTFSEWPCVDIVSLFGVEVSEEQRKIGRYDRNQVFKTSLCRRLLNKMQNKWRHGEPIIVVEKYEVLKNDFWGIEGGWEVEILWYYLEDSAIFRHSIGKDVQAELNKGAESELHRFPNYRTFGQQKDKFIDIVLTKAQINLLSTYTEWCLLHNRSLIQRFILGHELKFDGIAEEEEQIHHGKGL